MNILKLILLILFAVTIRRVYLAVTGSGVAGTRTGSQSPSGDSSPDANPNGPLKDLSDQDISDADFEEIP